MATGTVIVKDTAGAGKVRKIQWDWTATAGGLVVSDPLAVPVAGLVVAMETDPDVGTPPAAYTFTVTNDQGSDVMLGAGTARSTTANEFAFPASAGIPVMVPLRDTNLTVTIAGAGAGGKGRIILYILQPA